MNTCYHMNTLATFKFTSYHLNPKYKIGTMTVTKKTLKNQTILNPLIFGIKHIVFSYFENKMLI